MRVVITGGSGFLANHLIKYLQENSSDLIDEIWTIDRKPFYRFLDYPSNILMKHFRCDICNIAKIEELLFNVNIVFHLARKPLQYLFQLDQKALNDLYMRENFKATQCLVDSMIVAGVPNLVYVGDAYANLPPADNFGTSESIHADKPSTYLLGEYGASRTAAELYARNKNGQQLSNGKTLNSIFFRPTFIYGEGERHLAEAFHAIADQNNGCITHFTGPSRSLHQYIYAGNLAQMIENSMRCMLDDPQRCTGEFFYCMDDMHCTRFTKFFKPIIKALGYHTGSKNLNFYKKLDKKSSIQDDGSRNYLFNYSKCVVREIAARQFSLTLAWWKDNNSNMLSSYALRLFFAYGIGFPNRKATLLFGPRQSTLSIKNNSNEIARSMMKTTKWVSENIKTSSNAKYNTINNEKLLIVPEGTSSNQTLTNKFNELSDRMMVASKNITSVLKMG